VDLINQLVSGLGINGDQAKGGAGLLFQLAKDKLGAGDFGKIVDVVPGIGDMLKAAPSGGVGAALGGAVSSLGGGEDAGGLASLAGGFSQLGLDSGLIQKFVPIILSFVQSKGGDVLKNLLAGVFK
jgi:hypothetical protein